MKRIVSLAAACTLASTLTPSAQQPDPLKAAADALGVASIKTLQFSGSGANFSVGQNYTAGEPWPRVTVKSFTALVNYDTASMRQELLREMGTVMPRGGGAPFTGEQRQIQLVSGNYAWNLPAPAPVPPGGAAQAAGGRGGAPAPAAAPAPANQAERMLFIWSTPQGFVKAALANNATTKRSKGGTEVSFTVGGKYKMTGILDAQNRVERVRTWVDQSIVGDMPVETVYSGYRDFGGVQFPSRLVQSQDGFPALDLTVSAVVANPAVDISVPDNVRSAQPAPVVVTATKLADGVFHLTGGTHHSLAVEMKDHIVLVDTPNNEARALAVIAKAKEAIPGKPIRYVVTSHHHWDHLGGIRAAMDEGAIIVTHQSNRAFLERVAKTAHTINPDQLAASKKSVKIQTVGAKGTLTDGTRTIELHLLTNYEHTGDMLVAYLPKEKILAEPDAFTPGATPTTPLVVTAVPYAVALYDNIQRLRLDVQTIAPFHGARTTNVAELAAAAGKSGAAKTQ
jgi:glyoxylase-like metal-dependent hydrolase (beta-lactamase superfamily II)